MRYTPFRVERQQLGRVPPPREHRRGHAARRVNIANDLITTNKELRQKSLAKEKLTKDGTAKKDDATKKRDNLRKRLQRFVTRLPAFMYLTDDREKTIKGIILQVEPDLFEKVTELTLNDFKQFVDACVFNDAKMNDAVWKFRSFEEPSLHYEFQVEIDGTVRGWTLRRDERFAHTIEKGILNAGDVLHAADDPTVVAVVTDNYGLSVGGPCQESPDVAAAAVGQDGGDGWKFWTVDKGNGPQPLEVFG